MRFELSVAFKYLIPKRRQLSVSIISLVSVLVISLVVWLVIVFLSVTDGLEKKWVEELVALNAPVRMTPTEAYFKSYYHQIDRVATASNYTLKTIEEKLHSPVADPYDPNIDRELPVNFPAPDKDVSGNVKDLVKETWSAISQFPEVRPQEFEVSLGNLRLNLLRRDEGELKQTFLTQISYILSNDGSNERFQKLLLAPSLDDLNNLLATLPFSNSPLSEEDTPVQKEVDAANLQDKLKSFFAHANITALKTDLKGWRLPSMLIPQEGAWRVCAIVKENEIAKFYIPSEETRLAGLKKELLSNGFDVVEGMLSFDHGKLSLITEVGEKITPKELSTNPPIYLEGGIPFSAKFLPESIAHSHELTSLQFDVETTVQNTPLSGRVRFENLEIASVDTNMTSAAEALPFWVYKDKDESVIPFDTVLGDGIVISKHFKNNGVRIGDRGYLSYYSQTPTSLQEQRLPIYVAGFYDPGMMPAGNKLILVNPKLAASLRGGVTIADQMLGNGINLWLKKLDDAKIIKASLEESLKEKGIDRYWKVESFHDYEFSRPILQQLESDKNLFTLIAIIILVVACSNIISMLILLVNDKKREIGILQAMGVSQFRIGLIFGVCGFVTGAISSILGTVGAMVTLRYLQSLLNLLSFFQGHEIFQSAFYGTHGLPNQLSLDALVFVLIATTFISVLAGIIPAIKASRIRPSEILRSE